MYRPEIKTEKERNKLDPSTSMDRNNLKIVTLQQYIPNASTICGTNIEPWY
jgi:hypothetical protein